ncbi:MAG TPA: type VI secretion system accessory protein TagJ [Pyrinomonadaceae bacterium]|nr:type VI secretion system accessory protein TagJ [Pyrinomonadaceae bacterium]
MSRAKELFDAGRLDEAVEELLREVKANPNDVARRTFLFELSCFAGDLDRAERQLDVIGHQSAQAEAGVVVYRNLIRAERDRRRLLPDGLQPHFLSEPPSYVDMHLDALNRLREGNIEQARRALDIAEEERPAFRGRVNGEAFEDFRDYDDLFGPVLELFVQDKYTWLPFEQIVSLQVEEPKQLRDLLWTGAAIQTTDKALKAYLPVLYPGTHEHADGLVRLGRMTDWRELGPELFLGAGLHLFAVNGEEKPLLEVRTVEFDHGGESAMTGAE